MILVLVGKTCSGKSYLKEAYIKNGYKSLITYTTRKPREGEVDGVDYHFIDESTMYEMASHGDIVEMSRHGDSYYGSPKCPEDNENYVITLDPRGAKAYGALYDCRCIVVKASDEVRHQRAMKRGMTEESWNNRESVEADWYEVDTLMGIRKAIPNMSILVNE